MLIDHTLTIHAPVDRVWPVLQQPEVVVESLPGVELTSLDGENFTGTMSVGLGPMRLRYGGEGTLRYDVAEQSIHISAKGSEVRGAGNASAVVDVAVRPGAEDSTVLAITIDIDLQGKPAQFGRGILSEVITRLATQFGKNLERQVAAPETPDPAAAATGAETATTVPTSAGTPSPAPTATPSRPPEGAFGRQGLTLLAGAAIGAAVALVARRPRHTINITVLGGDDTAWLELVRALTRR